MKVTAENAEKVFGTSDVLDDVAIRNLRRKLDVERQPYVDKATDLIKGDYLRKFSPLLHTIL